MVIRGDYQEIWKSEEAHKRLFEKISAFGIDSQEIKPENVDQLKGKISLEDLACVSPPILSERMYFWPGVPLSYEALRSLKVQLIDEEGKKTGRLTGEQIAFASRVEDYCQDGIFSHETYTILRRGN